MKTVFNFATQEEARFIVFSWLMETTLAISRVSGIAIMSRRIVFVLVASCCCVAGIHTSSKAQAAPNVTVRISASLEGARTLPAVAHDNTKNRSQQKPLTVGTIRGTVSIEPS
jgi:hypothetical protein